MTTPRKPASKKKLPSEKASGTPVTRNTGIDAELNEDLGKRPDGPHEDNDKVLPPGEGTDPIDGVT